MSLLQVELVCAECSLDNLHTIIRPPAVLAVINVVILIDIILIIIRCYVVGEQNSLKSSNLEVEDKTSD